MLALLYPRLALSSLVVLSSFATVQSSALITRNESLAQPLPFTPDNIWGGIDGSWNTFTLRVGSPEQTVHVLPSWMSYQTLVVAPEGCSVYSDYDSCSESRGDVFNKSQSTTWKDIGTFQWGIEQNLDISGNSYYGYDVVVLGESGESMPSLANTTVGAFGVSDFWTGVFGLNPKSTNWTADGVPAPSYMTMLKEQNHIPSISFGYTAGAIYRSTKQGSLTLGGYDQNRFEPNAINFDFAANDERDIVVAVQKITTRSANSSDTVNLLPTPMFASIDSTVSHLWLPWEACQAFEDEFGLIYDNETDLYLVNSSLHDSLLRRNAQVNITLGSQAQSVNSVTISLPYAAFDLEAQTPYRGLAENTAYFPLRRAENETQYTLGRTFMQEAYISVDYERATFNVSQCSWGQENSTNIVAIPPAPTSENSGYNGASSGVTDSAKDSSSSKLSRGAIAGIVVGCVLGIGALVAGFWFLRRDKRKKSPIAERENAEPSSRDSNTSLTHTYGVGEKGTHVFPKAELEGSSAHEDIKPQIRPESSIASPTTAGYSTWSSGDVGPLSPASEAGGLEIFEMPGDMPEVAQADGQAISEKQMMQRREEMYNGVDPSNPSTPIMDTPRTDRAESDPIRRVVRPEEVVMHDEIREHNQPQIAEQRRFSFE